MSDFKLRYATIEDAAIIARHRVAMFRDMGGYDLQRLDALYEEYQPWVRSRIQEMTYIGVLANSLDDVETIVAGAGLWIITDYPPGPVHPGSRRGMIFNVYTEPDFRQKGLARQMMEKLLSDARQRDLAVIILHASTAGRHLYESLGFVQTNEMRLYLA